MEEPDCSYCLASFKENEKLYTTECNHIFHEICFNEILNYNKNKKHDVLCPNCNKLLIKYEESLCEINIAIPVYYINNHRVETRNDINIKFIFIIIPLIIIILYIFILS